MSRVKNAFNRNCGPRCVREEIYARTAARKSEVFTPIIIEIHMTDGVRCGTAKMDFHCQLRTRLMTCQLFREHMQTHMLLLFCD